jgi:hypothetical protein
MPLASSDQLSFYPVGVVVPVRAGSRVVWAGVREARRQRPRGLPMAATFVAALFDTGGMGGG